MKKNLINIVLIFSFIISYSQRTWTDNPNAQKNNYERAKKYLKEYDTIYAISNLYFSYNYGKNTDLGKKIKKELDLLVEIKRENLLRSIKGKWKLKSAGTNWGFGEVDKNLKNETILIINSDSISFYKKNKKTKILTKIKSEKINFTEICYNCEEAIFYFHFSDNQIWIIKPNKSNTIIHFKNDGYFNKNGTRTKISCGNSEMDYVKVK